ncbi:carbonic anhydrase family protein [Polaribacter sp. Z022]|uniref:carbonic anhydrase family protein n=1 Tax=Polaribacter sp. Z022 TaxID=2927125 RepID=UPI002021A463|nr:carbonic anhydrase family protein [Polaribacter sp. Z022]MCL7752417.1 carbonic anhydrase family protein [Polaribacter sp. Z022]
MKNIAINKEVQNGLTPQSVLSDLIEGNNRFIDNNLQAADYNALVKDTVGGQFPKAVVLSCIDSRVPVEQVFDQTIGDIFVARVAGNFENVDILGSLEYSCAVAGSKLVLVLGHESCGAVKAACDGVELGNITAMLDNIGPAVKVAALDFEDDVDSTNKDFVAKTVEQNVRLTIERIREKSQILADLESKGAIEIVGGVYSLQTGKVELL